MMLRMARALGIPLCLLAASLTAGTLHGNEGAPPDATTDPQLAAPLTLAEYDGPHGSLAAEVAPFDIAGKWTYAEALPEAVRDTLIRLNSRFVLPDPGLEMPEEADPHTPIWLKLNGEMCADFRATLDSLGGELLGYSNRYVYLVRAASASSLSELRQWWAREPAVIGSRLMEPLDRTEAHVWRDHVVRRDWQQANFRVVFFRDTPASAAEALLEHAGAVECFALRREEAAGAPLRLEAFPIVHLTLTPGGLAAVRRSPWVEMIEQEPVPKLLNQDSVTVSNTAAVYDPPYNLTGAGQLAAIWDGGFAEYNNEHHPDYAARVVSAEGPSGSTGGRRHAIHVMGTILGDGGLDAAANNYHGATGLPHARGYAPEAQGIVWDFFGTIELQRQQSRHEYFHIVDNHSWTYTVGAFGSYSSYARATDEQNRDLLLSYVKSAGNDGSGDMTVRGDKGNKNGLTVAAVRPDNHEAASFSSRGPMNDGRLHPFIANNGVWLRSCDYNNGWTYRTASGTSMSAPSTTGAITLLSEHWGNLHGGMPLQPDIVMAVLANTAQEAGNPGPDYVYGHGIVDTQAAADLMVADADTQGGHIVRGQYEQGSEREYRMQVSSDADPLSVTLHWHDETNMLASTVVLVNDLDLELEDPSGTIHYPYRGLSAGGSQSHQFTADGPNRRDNTIRAVVENPMPGDWTVRVRAHTVPLPETRYGYVLASSHALDRTMHRAAPSFSSPVAIPADNPDGLLYEASVPYDVPLDQLRVYLYATHPDRRQLRVTLTHPSGATLELARPEREAPDLIAVFPDTKDTLADVREFAGLSAKGTWRVRVADLEPGAQGELHYLGLEWDLVNLPPHVHLEGGGRYEIGEPVLLDASQSVDPNGYELGFRWSQVSGLPVTLNDAETATASFTTPPVTQKEDLVFEVEVSDGQFEIPALLTVTVLPANNPPTAAVVHDTLVAHPGEEVLLDASPSSDPDQDPLSFRWTQLEGPEPAALERSEEVRARLRLAQNRGTMLFEVQVEDGRGGSDSTELTVHVREPEPSGCGASPGKGREVASWWLLGLVLLYLSIRRRRESDQLPAGTRHGSGGEYSGIRNG